MLTSAHHQLEPVDPGMLSKALHQFMPYSDRQRLYQKLIEEQKRSKVQHVRVAEIVADKSSYLGREVRYGFINGKLTDAGRNLAGDPQHNSILVLDGTMYYVGLDHTVNILPKES